MFVPLIFIVNVKLRFDSSAGNVMVTGDITSTDGIDSAISNRYEKCSSVCVNLPTHPFEVESFPLILVLW